MENVLDNSPINGQASNSERELGSGNIKKLFLKYSLAALAGMGAQMVSVIADGLFVGNGIGPTGLASISIIVPFWTLFVAIQMLIGIGAMSLSGINLGKGDTEEARSFFGQGFWYCFILSIIISMLVIFNLNNLIQFLGGAGEVAALVKTYLLIYMLAFPFNTTGIYLFYYVRLDEKPVLGTIAMIVPAIAAVVTEYIFIFKMNLGIAGSALSWVVCVAPCFLLVLYFMFGKTIFRIKLSDLKFDFKKINEINKVGFASFIIQIATTVLTIVVNNLLGAYGGELDLASYGIINAYVLYVLVTVVSGFVIAIQPIASFNSGANLAARVRETIIVGSRYTFITIVGILAVIFILGKQIIGFFAGGSPELTQLGASNMVVFLALFPLGAISIVASGYFQAIEHNGKAIFNGITRIFIFAVPLVFLFSKIWGLSGIWYAQPVADGLAFIVAILFIFKELNRLKKLS